MALTASQIIKVRSSLHRAYSGQQLPMPWTKPDVDIAIGNTDTWLTTNQGSFNTALSEPFQTDATAADKTILLIGTAIAQRLISTPSHIAVLRQILGELDGIDGV